MPKIEFVPNKITPEYWQQPRVRTWAEPKLRLLQYLGDAKIAKRKSSIYSFTPYGESIVEVITEEDTVRVMCAGSFNFDGDSLRAKAFLIAVGYYGINPEAQSFNELWTKQSVKQEVA